MPRTKNTAEIAISADEDHYYATVKFTRGNGFSASFQHANDLYNFLRIIPNIAEICFSGTHLASSVIAHHRRRGEKILDVYQDISLMPEFNGIKLEADISN